MSEKNLNTFFLKDSFDSKKFKTMKILFFLETW